MNYERLKNLLQLLQSSEIGIKTFADLKRFKQEYNIKTNEELKQAILLHIYKVVIEN